MSVIFDLDQLSVSLKQRRILDRISLTVSAGEFVGLIGPNGAGKTTLLRAAANLIGIDSGTRRIDGSLIEALDVRDRARRLSYLPQSRPVYWGIGARAVVALGRFAYGAPLIEDARDAAAIDRALAGCRAAHLAPRSAGELSGGELARIHLARALAGETPLLLADEPIAALDPAHQLDIMALLRGKADAGDAVIAALHDLQLAARYCTRLVVIHEGRIALDATPEKLSDEVLLEIFHVKADRDNEDHIVSLSPP